MTHLFAALLLAQPVAFDPPPLTYSEATAIARAEKLPLVVFVGCKERRISGTVTCKWTGKEPPFGDSKTRIIVSKDGYWLADLPVDASDGQISEMATSSTRQKRASVLPLMLRVAGVRSC